MHPLELLLQPSLCLPGSGLWGTPEFIPMLRSFPKLAVLCAPCSPQSLEARPHKNWGWGAMARVGLVGQASPLLIWPKVASASSLGLPGVQRSWGPLPSESHDWTGVATAGLAFCPVWQVSPSFMVTCRQPGSPHMCMHVHTQTGALAHPAGVSW